MRNVKVKDMSSVVDEVLLGGVELAGLAALAAAGTVGKLALGVGQGLSREAGLVMQQIQEENRKRLELEQEWILNIRKERENALSKINSLVNNLRNISEKDALIAGKAYSGGAGKEFDSLVRKRNAKLLEIRRLRDQAIAVNDIDKIKEYSQSAKRLYDSLQGEIQDEIVGLARHGIRMPQYGSMNDGAVLMALAKKKDVFDIRLNSLDANSMVTEEMVLHDLAVFEDSLSEFLCEDGLNDRQLRDLLAIKQDLKKIGSDRTISLDIKRKRLRTLFDTYSRRARAFKAELIEMREYYDKYILETFDIPDERLEMADFDNIDEVGEAIKEARKKRLERIKHQYVQMQVDRVMKKHGLNLIDSAVMGRKEDDRRILYGIDENAAVEVFVSQNDNSNMSAHVVGINFGEKAGVQEEDKLVEKEKKFCNKMSAIEADLEDVGIILRRKKTLPPGKDHITWVQLDKEVKVQRNKIRRKKKNTDTNRYMYMG